MYSDTHKPYSYKTWLSIQSNNLSDDPDKLYLQYLNNWYVTHTTKNVNPKTKIKEEYIQLLKDLSFLFNKDEKNLFLRSIDYNNTDELIYSIPLFAKKLKEIARVLNAKRNSIKNTKLKHSLIGSNDGIETLFYDYILRSFTKNENSLTQIPTSIVKYNLPSLSSIKQDFYIEIEEMYDTNTYHDSDPDIHINQYVNVQDVLSDDTYADLTDDELVSILNSRFIPRVANSNLSKIFQAYLNVSSNAEDLTETEENNLLEYEKRINYQINATEKYLGESLYGLTAVRLKDLNKPDHVLNVDFGVGNNWFIWPSGSKIIDDTRLDNYLKPIDINDSNFVNSGATGGSSYKDSDLIFTDKNGTVEGAWLRGPRTITEKTSTSVNILPGSVREFIYPYVGYNITTKGLNWIGHSLDDHAYANFDLLSQEQKINLLKNYYTKNLPNGVSNSFYLNNSTLVDCGAEAGDNTLTSDVIIKSNHRTVLEQTYNSSISGDVESAFLYKFNKTDIPIAPGLTNIYWPIKETTSNENIPITIKKDHSVPVPLANLKISEVMNGATAGLSFDTSDVIYKLNNRYSEPIEAAWLGTGSIRNLDLNNKSKKIYDEDALFCAKYVDGPTQAALNLKIGAGKKVSFIWCDVDTDANEVFKNFEHSPVCEYAKTKHDYYSDQDYLNPTQINETDHWKKCTCKSVYYSPIGHIGDSPLDYNRTTDLLFADPEGLKDNFTFTNWKDTRGYDAFHSPQFAHFKLTGNDDSPIGWGDGYWKTGANKPFILKTGRRYTYFRTSLRLDSSVNDISAPYYIVKYSYKELKGFCQTNNSSNGNGGSNSCFDLFILLDISKSQKLSIQQTKDLVINISKTLLVNSNNKNIQIGVVSFDTTTNIVSYLTKSHGGLEFYVKNIIQETEYPDFRTNILNALKVGNNFLYNNFPADASSEFDYKDLCTSLSNLIIDSAAKSKTLNLPQQNCSKKILIISDGEENTDTADNIIKYAETIKNSNVEIYSVDIGLRSINNNLMEVLASSKTKYYNLESYLKEGNGDVITFAQIIASNINGCDSVIPSWKKAIKNSSGAWEGISEQSDMVLNPGDFLIYVHAGEIYYESEDTNSNFSQDCLSFTINAKLNGWDYNLKKFDPKFIGEIYGGKPFWGVSDNSPNINKNFNKEKNHFSGQLRFFNDYVPLRQPEVSKMQIQNSNFLQYFRRPNTSFDWVQPITLSTKLSDYQWNKINFFRRISNLDEILKNGNFDFYCESIDEKSNLLLESYSDFRISRYNYFARSSFSYSQDIYDINRCDNTFVIFNTGSVIEPLEPYCNLLNVHFPTVATVDIPKYLISEKYFGDYLTPTNLGVSFYRGRGYTIDIDKNNATFYDQISGEKTFYDLNKYGNRNRGLTKNDQYSPVVIKDIDNRWVVDSFNSGNRMGMHINTLENQKFTPYQTTYEILNKPTLGITRQNDPIEFWYNSLPAIWNDEKNYPLTFRKELMASTYELRKNGLLVDKGLITNWRSDIFGNEYGLFK